MSKHQQVQATRLTNIPQEEFDAQVEMRLAEEYDAAQERGEVATGNRAKDFGVADDNAKPATAADLGLRRGEIHEARRFRDAERDDPGACRWHGVPIMFPFMNRRSTPQRKTDDAAFPVRVFLRVPEEGSGQRMDALHRWLESNVGRGEYSVHAGGRHPGRDMLEDRLAVYTRHP